MIHEGEEPDQDADGPEDSPYEFLHGRLAFLTPRYSKSRSARS